MMLIHTLGRRAIWVLALMPVIWVISVMMLGGGYSFPQTDDFCAFGRIFTHDAYNPFRDVGNLYVAWTGRYSSVFVVALTGWFSSVSPWPMYITYHISIVLLIFVFLAGCLLVSDGFSSSSRLNGAIAAIGSISSLTLMPSRLEGIYWLTGAAVYITGIGVFFALYKSISRDDSLGRERASVSFSFVTLALIFLCVGFNELLALSLGEFLFLRVIFFAKGSAYRKQNFAYGFVYLLSALITIFAPGNFARDKVSSVPRHEFFEAAKLASSSLEQFARSALIPNAPLIFATLIGVGGLAWALRPEEVTRKERLLPLLLALLSAMPVHLFTYSFLTGEESPGRIINQCYVMSLVGACILAAWLGAAASHKLRGRTRSTVSGVILFSIGLMFLASAPFRQVASTIRDFGPIWQSEQLQRMDALRAGHGNSIVLTPFSPEGNTPPLFQGGDVSEDPNYWVNTCMSSFYGVKEVRLRGKQ